MEPGNSEVRKIIHDLNNVLAATLGSAELIAFDAEEASQLHQDAQNIKAAALRGRELVETLREHLELT
jgi:hypothetical protein